jgi:membrane protease YdiL (CAAX protease family)
MLGMVWLVMVVAWAGWLLRPARSAVLPPYRRRAVSWGGAEVLLALFISQFLWPSVLAQGLRTIGFFGWIYGPDFQAQLASGALQGNDSNRVKLWVTDLAAPLTVVSILALLYVLSGARPYQFGLTMSRLMKNVLLGVMSAVCVVPVVYMILFAVNGLLRLWTGESPEEHPITRLIQSHPPPIDLVVGGLAAIVAAPFTEEFLFRGIIQPWFRTRSWGGLVGIAGALFLSLYLRLPGLQAGWREHGWAGAWPELLPVAFVLLMAPGYFFIRARAPAPVGAVYATALLFGAAHSFAWPSPVPLFFFALALGALRYRTQSLVPSVVTHGLFNAVAWVILLLPQPVEKPEKGKEATDARPRVELISTSSAVPGSVLPRRTNASAMTVPSPGE